MNLREVENVLAGVSFGPSCIKAQWSWEVGPSIEGTLLRVCFVRPDRDTGSDGVGRGRWWHVPEDAAVDAVVKTAFAAAKQIVEHELMESFHYGIVRLFDPHHTIADLEAAAEHHRRGFRNAWEPRVGARVVATDEVLAEYRGCSGVVVAVRQGEALVALDQLHRGPGAIWWAYRFLRPEPPTNDPKPMRDAAAPYLRHVRDGVAFNVDERTAAAFLLHQLFGSET